MTNQIETFERPDLFEQDTWNKQVIDVYTVIDAVQSGAIAGGGLPVVLWGHSRGGVASLLASGRAFRDDRAPLPSGLITLSAPESACRMTDDALELMKANGFVEVVSNRTGQTLRIDRRWLDEQLEHPKDHDVLDLASGIRCPSLILHGADDPTVPADCAGQIAEAIQCGGGTAESVGLLRQITVF
jgi:fermentation-respiration switch protein FrsA (DUF1100 family)